MHRSAVLRESFNTAATHPLSIPGLVDQGDTRRQARRPRSDPSSKWITRRWQAAMQSKTTDSEYFGMLLQPDSSPISEKALAHEIQSIYNGVQTVELKCIDIDSALARDTKIQLGVEQWQALIALHRTLLYEHHDFLMATQHPSTSPELQALATKYSMPARMWKHHDFLMGMQHSSAVADLQSLSQQYSMPARMWKHAVHAFLEALRHRRPDSKDNMLAYVVLAYQMMALRYENCPADTETWIECLGDFERMAVQDDRELHAVREGSAAPWYMLASNGHPRADHYLAVVKWRTLSDPSGKALYPANALYSADPQDAAGFDKVQITHDGQSDGLRKDSQALDAMSGTSRTFLSSKTPLLVALKQASMGIESPSGQPELSGILPCQERTAGCFVLDCPCGQDIESNTRSMPEAFLQSDSAPADTSKTCSKPFETVWYGIKPGMQSFATMTARVASAIRLIFAQGESRKSHASKVNGHTGSWLKSMVILLWGHFHVVSGHPLPAETPRREPHALESLTNWACLLLPLALGSLWAYFISRKPLSELNISSLMRNVDLVSALAFFLAQNTDNLDAAPRLFILASWAAFWMANMITRYRMTAGHFQDRYLSLVILGGPLAAFMIAAVSIIIGNDVSARQAVAVGRDILPLGLSSFSWIFYELWRQSERGDGTGTMAGEGLA